MESTDSTNEKEVQTGTGRQRFKPSKLEFLIGMLIVLGFFYLGYLVLAKEGGDTRKLDNRLKALESKMGQLGEAANKELPGIKAGFQQLETRLKALEDQQKQLDSQLKQMQARAAAPAPKPAVEEKKSASPPATGREKTIHKIKKGETIYSIARKYHVYVQEILQWNKLPPNPTLKVGDSLVIYKR